MAEKDELAKLLGDMAGGQPVKDELAEPQDTDEEGSEEEGGEHGESASEPAPAGTAETTSAQPAAAAPIGSPAAPRRRVGPPRRQHLVQTLGFKQTMIPVLLTLGFLCPAVCIVGRMSDEMSPLAAFARIGFAIPTMLVGLLFLALAGVTIFQVRSELERKKKLAAAGR